MSYIDPHDVLTMIAVVAVLAWCGFLMDASRWGRAIPGVVAILVAGSVLSNLHITPYSSDVAGFIGQYIVAAAIPLLMIKADLRKIFVESGRVMLSFAAACIGTVAGALLGYYLLAPWHVSAKVVGMFAGAFVGGTISMVAVANAVQMTPSELAVATGASMIPSILGLMALVALPNLAIVRRLFPEREPRQGAAGTAELAAAATAIPEFRLTHIAGALAVSFTICALAKGGEHLATRLLGHDQGPYYILYVTTVTILAANLFAQPLRQLRGEFDLGMIFMYLFFAMIGLGVNLTSFLDHAVSLFFYVLLLLTVCIGVTMVLSRLMRLDLPEAITGCGAAIVGPAATVAVVAGKGWHAMISPAVMTGIFCHVVGNFIGISVYALLH